MTVLYTNNAATTLAATISNSATSMSVASGAGALFPSPGAGDFFYMTLVDSGGSIEIVKVTARTNDTMTITRAQDGTTALAFASGSKAELRITKGMLDQLKLDAAGGSLIGSTTVTTPSTYNNPGAGVVVLGYNAIAGTTSRGIAIGLDSQVNGNDTMAIGRNAYVEGATTELAIAIGTGASIGDGAHSSIALGNGAMVATGAQNATAIGYGVHAFSSDTVALGRDFGTWTPGFFVSPYVLRDATHSQTSIGGLQYDITTGEIFYRAGTGNLVGYTHDFDVNASPAQFGEVALGQGAGATSYGVAIGGAANNLFGDGVAIGYTATAQMMGTAVGREANASGNNGVAIGANATGTETAVAVGYYASAQSTASIAIGSGVASTPGAISIGGQASSSSGSSMFGAMAIGQYATVTEGGIALSDGGATHNGIAIGFGLTGVTADGAIVLQGSADPLTNSLQAQPGGFFVKPIRDNSIGQYADGTLKYSLLSGEIFYEPGSGGLIGFTDSSSIGAVALGFNANATGSVSTAIGSSATSGSFSVAVGTNSHATEAESVAVGSNVTVGASGSIVIGYGAATIGTATNSIAIGHFAVVNDTAANSIVIGAGSATTSPNAIVLSADPNPIVAYNSGFYVKPIRDSSNSQTATGTLQYDSTTGEIFYGAGGGGGLSGLTTTFDTFSGAFGETALGAYASAGGQIGALYGVAIGFSANVGTQVVSGIAVGNSAFSGASGGIAIGSSANIAGGSDNSIVIGTGTTYSPWAIVLNAQSGPLVTYTSGLYVKPVRENSSGQISAGGLSYDSTTGEIYSDDNLIAERGTFTPILKGTIAGANISGTGYYRRVGKQVTVHIEFQNVSTSGHNGTTRISGLPFTIAGYYSQTGHAKVYSWGTLSSNKVMSFFDAGNTYVDLYTQDTNGNWSALAISAGASRYVVVDGTYMID